MARVLMSVLGSLGDLNPFLRMGEILRADGHHVILATSSHYRDRVERSGLEILPINPDYDHAEREGVWDKANHSVRGSEYVMREVILPYLEETFERIESVPDIDLYISHTLTFPTPIVAEVKQKPWVSVVLQPMLIFSVDDPPLVPGLEWSQIVRERSQSISRAFNFVGSRLSMRFLGPVMNLRKRAGLRVERINPLFGGGESASLVLAAFPRAMAPRAKEAVRYLGFPFFDEKNQSLESPLARFLSQGSAPYVFTLGTAIVNTTNEFFETAAESLSRLKDERALLICGDRAIEIRERIQALDLDLANRIFVTGFSPYSLVFPRAKAVIHQGGIGTTSQVLRAGVPQLVVPFAHDQPDNARRIKRLGVGESLPAVKLTSKRLVEKLVKIDNEFYRLKAKHVALEMTKDSFTESFRQTMREILSRTTS